MSKTVQLRMPAGKGLGPADRWVKDRPAIEDKAAAPERPQMKRFTIDVSQELHSRIKVTCARRGINMADELRRLLEQAFPAS